LSRLESKSGARDEITQSKYETECEAEHHKLEHDETMAIERHMLPRRVHEGLYSESLGDFLARVREIQDKERSPLF